MNIAIDPSTVIKITEVSGFDLVIILSETILFSLLVLMIMIGVARAAIYLDERFFNRRS